ncbi:MAG TPA: DUF898 family protein, partial [Stellaceae bacterium]|nr:DUF898 family protein [Stellaceae bacterium]
MPPSPPPPAPRIIRFADAGGLLNILIRNALLTLVTLGIYRFWARAAMRRYWWGSVVVDGDPLEYTGTGGELFMGFLAFLSILVPLGLVYGVVEVYAQTTVWGPLVLLAIQLTILFVLIPVALFRARRYRLSRTSWRGIRGGLEGSTWRYLGITLLGVAASILTIGGAVPWMRIAQTRYATNCSRFGDRDMRFDGKSSPLVVPWLCSFHLPLLALVIGAVVVGVAAVRFGPNPDPTPEEAARLVQVMMPGFMSIFVGYMGLFVGMVWYGLYEFRYMARHTSIGGVRFGSDLKPGTMAAIAIGLYFAVYMCVMLAAIPFFVAAGVLGVIVSGVDAHPEQPPVALFL